MPSLYLPLRARRPRVAFCAATFLVFLVTTVFYAIRGIPYRRSVAPEPVRVPSYGYPHAPVPTGVPMPVSVTAPYIKNGTADVGTAGPGDAAGNATLGFQKLLALSVRPGWRSRGLEAAANLTGLTFDIPRQPRNPEAFVEAFREIGVAGTRDGTGVKIDNATTTAIKPNLGSARAWIAHLDLLKYVVAAGFETAFIVEDDVDFDVRIKTQMRLVSESVRAYMRGASSSSPSPPLSSLSSSTSSSSSSSSPDHGHDDHETTPFGTAWDVLWLGHCGATIDADLARQPLRYADPTRCPTTSYVGWWTANLEARVPAGHRVVQDAGHRTVCTFGYGVTRRSAQKILSALGAGGGEAFDVLLAARCREGTLRCLVVNPQLFQHYEPMVGLGQENGQGQGQEHGGGGTSLVRVGNGDETLADESAFEDRPGSTANIVLSARCRALFGTTCLRESER